MKSLILFLSCLMIGCVNATVEDSSLCQTVSLANIPAAPVAGITVPPVSFSTDFDYSNTISKIGNVANNLTVNITQLTVNSQADMSWVSTVDVSIQSSTLPEVPFATYTYSNDPGNQVSMQPHMDAATVLQYLSNPVVLTFTVSGTSQTQAMDLTSTMCLSVSGHFSKSL